MTNYTGITDFDHVSAGRTGVLLMNLGTPDAPTTSAVRRYLKEFLWDPRVVEVPRPLWWLILNGVILNIRPSRSARAYAKVWTDRGSPLLSICQDQHQALSDLFQAEDKDICLGLGMRYGNPSIEQALESLRRQGVRRLLVLPLYPQYSATTTASCFDRVADVLKTWRWQPELRFINHYHTETGYINALAASVRQAWDTQPAAEKLMLSFHGLPQRYLQAGDPYYCECAATTRLLAETLGLDEGQYLMTFQSRVGREPWLQPYTDHQLQQWAQSGVESVDVLCPGFSADCLETLEEIDMQNRELFLASGGKQYRYIPALNTREDHIRFLHDLLLRHLQGWELSDTSTGAEREARRQRAMAKGAKQ